MRIIHNDVGLFLLVVDNQHAFEVWPLDLGPPKWAGNNAMSQHAEPQERERDSLGEEDAAEESRHIGKGIANETNDQILEWRCFLDKRRAFFLWNQEASADELIWNQENFGNYEYQYTSHSGGVQTYRSTATLEQAMSEVV